MAERDTNNKEQGWKKNQDAGKKGIPGAERSYGASRKAASRDSEEDESDLELDAEEMDDEEAALDLEDDSYVEEDVAGAFEEQKGASRRGTLDADRRPVRE